jgi:hypothetical protein
LFGNGPVDDRTGKKRARHDRFDAFVGDFPIPVPVRGDGEGLLDPQPGRGDRVGEATQGKGPGQAGVAERVDHQQGVDTQQVPPFDSRQGKPRRQQFRVHRRRGRFDLDGGDRRTRLVARFPPSVRKLQRELSREPHQVLRLAASGDLQGASLAGARPREELLVAVLEAGQAQEEDREPRLQVHDQPVVRPPRSRPNLRQSGIDAQAVQESDHSWQEHRPPQHAQLEDQPARGPHLRVLRGEPEHLQQPDLRPLDSVLRLPLEPRLRIGLQIPESPRSVQVTAQDREMHNKTHQGQDNAVLEDRPVEEAGQEGGRDAVGGDARGAEEDR